MKFHFARLVLVLSVVMFAFHDGLGNAAAPPAFVSPALDVKISDAVPVITTLPIPPPLPAPGPSYVQAKADFLVLVTESFTGEGVANLTVSNFSVTNHFSPLVCSGTLVVRQFDFQIENLGSGAYRLTVLCPIGCNERPLSCYPPSCYPPPAVSTPLQVVVSYREKRGQGIVLTPGLTNINPFL